MAEQEVIKHTKKVYKIWNSKEHNFWYKLREFAIEIFIIVFAVSLSIWFHSWSEHRNEQKQVKTFLLGLKKDIEKDINEVNDIKKIYENYRVVYTYLSNLNEKVKPDTNTLSSMISQINSNIFLRVHKTRFNSFLSAGKILNIEDEDLSLQILNYYQETIPSLQSSEGGWLSRNNDLNSYITNNLKDNSTLAYWEVLVTPKANLMTNHLIPWEQLLERYENVINDGKKIIEAINKEYTD
jgi:hypothetical protein